MIRDYDLCILDNEIIADEEAAAEEAEEEESNSLPDSTQRSVV